MWIDPEYIVGTNVIHIIEDLFSTMHQALK